MATVHLKTIDSSNWREALEIRSTPEQVEFVTEYEPVALLILAKASVGEGGFLWEPIAFYEGETMVGTVALSHDGFACQVHHFLIDQAFQRRGLGRASMTALVDHIRAKFPDCAEVTLTANPRNNPAQSLYRSVGFVPTGEERTGGPIWQYSFAN